MKKTNRLIVGSALSLAAIAVAIDHTQHRLPDPIPAEQVQDDMVEEESPCGLSSESPCSMDSEESSSPCSMDTGSVDSDSDESSNSPCGLGD